ncbi:hypothetical protein [Raoultibacter phocaeensis]|uniref:hypothetical protein n=1 Tax=Raoultibacter phocaeensis TaxID=2479841 RepID=UPI001118C773|nr:hypothetical protein [Raoultibacter phocaeensis]
MSDIPYFGTYARFSTASKKDAAALIGADNLVGDIFSIEFITEDGVRTAWMKNRFGALMGFFDPGTSRELSLYEAKGYTLQALLSFVAYSESPDPGEYWGEAAIICYDPNFAEALECFTGNIAARLMDGIRPEVDLGEQGFAKVIESNGTWKPTKTVPFPSKKAGSALLKTRRSMSEKMIEQGRKGNKGCYLISWLFLLALVAGAMFGLKSCGVF